MARHAAVCSTALWACQTLKISVYLTSPLKKITHVTYFYGEPARKMVTSTCHFSASEAKRPEILGPLDLNPGNLGTFGLIP